MSESRTATEIPEALKRLLRYVLDGFYSPECNYVMTLLIHHPCIKEDDLALLTKFDKKQLRACLNTLKLDQFIGCRMQMETGEDKKAMKHNYYFIRYTLFINVVKYKLHYMREKIESKEKEAIYRDTFKCPYCLKTFNDLDAGDLFDQVTGTFKCTLCLNVVEEQMPDKNEDCTNLMAVFNEEMKPIYDCLEEIDNIKLSDFILNPIPIKDLQSRTSKRNISGKGSNGNDNISWNGDVTKNISFMASESDPSTPKLNSKSSGKKKTKDRSLAWMQQNTIQSTFQGHEKSSKKSSGSKNTVSIEAEADNNSQNNQDIIKTLLSHEKVTSAPLPAIQTSFQPYGTHQSERKDNQEHIEMDDDEDDEDDDFYVTISGVATHYNNITPEIVGSMSNEEKEEYIRVGREMHEYFD